MQEYSLDTSTCGPMVLDALIAIKDKQVPQEPEACGASKIVTE